MRFFNHVVLVWFVATLVAGCAGRAANPVMVQQYGDQEKSCNALEREMAFIESEIHRLVPQTEKTGENVALGIAGAFLIFPWFFMDLSKAEQIEVDAYRQRYNGLLIIADEKGCGLEKETIPDPKEAAKKQKEAKAEAAKSDETSTEEAKAEEEKAATDPQ